MIQGNRPEMLVVMSPEDSKFTSENLSATLKENNCMLHTMEDIKEPAVVTDSSLEKAKAFLKKLVDTLVTKRLFVDDVVEEKPISIFRYVREEDLLGNINNLGGITFLVNFEPAKAKLEFSFAYCSSNDNFSKAHGRRICVQKMETGGSYVVENFDHNLSLMTNIFLALHYERLQRKAKDDNLSSEVQKLTIISHSEEDRKELSRARKYMKKFYLPSDILSIVTLIDLNEEVKNEV